MILESPIEPAPIRRETKYFLSDNNDLKCSNLKKPTEVALDENCSKACRDAAQQLADKAWFAEKLHRALEIAQMNQREGE